MKSAKAVKEGLLYPPAILRVAQQKCQPDGVGRLYWVNACLKALAKRGYHLQHKAPLDPGFQHISECISSATSQGQRLKHSLVREIAQSLARICAPVPAAVADALAATAEDCKKWNNYVLLCCLGICVGVESAQY